VDGRRGKRTNSKSATSLCKIAKFLTARRLINNEFKDAYIQWKSGKISEVKAMQEIGVKKTTF